MSPTKTYLLVPLTIFHLLVAAPISAQITTDFTCVALKDENNGVALLTTPLSPTAGTTAYQTSDGGKTWTTTSGEPLKLFDLTYADGNTIYACGQEFTPLDLYGTVQKTTDGGETWQGIYTFFCPPEPCDPGAGFLYSISFWDANTGVAVGSPAAVVLISSDTPTFVDAGSTGALRGVATPAASVAIAVGDAGQILWSPNGGLSWSPQTSHTTEQLNDICFVNASTGTVVGNAGTILRTVDGGTTWYSQTSGTTADLNAVAFRDAGAGLAVGSGGTILSTIDGGVTWTPTTSHTTKTLNDVVLENKTIIAVGAEQTIITNINATVPVFFTGITANVEGDAVRVSWVTSGSDPVDGFRLYRTAEAIGRKLPVTAGLLPTSERTYLDHSISPGETYRYHVVAVLPNGSEVRSLPARVSVPVTPLRLFQNRPNPFNPGTRIGFSLPQTGWVTIMVFDAVGRRVAVVADRVFAHGVHEVEWDGRNDAGLIMPSGVYFYSVRTTGDVRTRKMMLIK